MKFDIIIVGAGVIGSSTAYHLKNNSPESKILLVDKNSKIAAGNTSKSAALYRNLFSSKTSRILSTSSIKFYEGIADKIGLKNLGYFWMFSGKDWEKSQKGLKKLNQDADEFEILAIDEIPSSLKINSEKSGEFKEIHCVLYGHRCGALSATKLANFYAESFKRLGGEILLNSEIKQITLSEQDRNYPPWADIKITSISDQNGVKFSADEYVFATGAWTNDLLAPIGIASHIYPKKRQLFTLKLADPTQMVSDPSIKTPILILPTGGIYIKPVLQNKTILVGCADNLGNPFQIDDYPPQADEAYFEDVIEPALNHYFPKLRNYKLFSMWAGFYAYYTPDYNPVIEKISNIFWVSGTSGSGIMKADAIGRIASGKILGKDRIELFDGTKFNIADLSLKNRNTDSEELVI